MKTYIHVNGQKIASNHKTGSREPVLTAKTYQSNFYGHEIIIFGHDGREAARVVYSPDKPLKSGARVWIETDYEVRVIDNDRWDAQ